MLMQQVISFYLLLKEIMKYINTESLLVHSEQEIRNLYPNTSFGVPFIAPDEYAVVFSTPKPNFNPVTQVVQESAPTLTPKGHWGESWVIQELPIDLIEKNKQEALVASQKVEADRIASLWSSAHDYEFQQVSGSAIGLLAIGVMQGLPKCLAVQSWIKSIWTLYYTRKATGSTDFDFSEVKDCPHSVPELMQELGL